MKPWIRSLLLGALVLVATVAAAALLAAPVHELLLAWGVLDAPGPAAEDHRGFLKVFRRLLLIPLAAALVIAIRPWRDMGLRRYGVVGPQARPGRGLLGLGLAVLVLCVVLAGHLASGWLRWEDPLRWDELGRRAWRGFAGALALSLVEEWFFRGWLVERLERRHAPWRAAALAALIFALLHAFKPSALTVEVSHDAAGALSALRGWLGHMVDPVAFGPAFVGLFLFALLLTAAWRRTGTLWTAVGVHVGAVWVLFTYGALTVREPERTWAGSRLLYDGPVLWGLLVLATWWLWPRPPASATRSDSGGSGAPGAGRSTT